MTGDFLIKPNSTAIVSPSAVKSIYADAAITAVAFVAISQKSKVEDPPGWVTGPLLRMFARA